MLAYFVQVIRLLTSHSFSEWHAPNSELKENLDCCNYDFVVAFTSVSDMTWTRH